MATDELRLPGEEVVVELGEVGAAPAPVGQSSARRTASLVGQYALLVALAAIVLLPLFYTLIQALSPPFSYLGQGQPPHPVDVSWKDRTWFTGGAFSVVARTALVAFALAWVQLRAGGGTVRRPRALAAPRRLAAVVLGVVAVAGLTSALFRALFERSPNTSWWWFAAVVGVTATQLVGLVERGRRLWASLVLAALTGVATVAIVTITVGAEVWTRAWDDGDLGAPLVRSLTITVLITVAQVVTSVLAAYAFAFLRFPAKGLVFAFFMGTLLLPLEVTLLGNVQTIRDLGWINSNQALVLPFAATAFGTFLIRQGFRGLPSEIHDATKLDGYGHLDFLWRFAVPLTRPVIASFTVISAIGAWNQYLWPQAVIDDTEFQTAQIRLRSIVGTEIANANEGIAAALIVAVPVAIVLVAFQRQIIRGLTAGAVKG
ncbi:MAG TPA: carbohydrate ABC transporter permease [Acidimicrobiales bacterium]